MKRFALALSLAAILAMPAADAAAWGNTGHRLVASAAIRGLPEELPAFLRTAEAAANIAELAREPDRWKGGERTHNRERSTAHFIDLTDDGHALTEGGPHISEMPELRSEYEAMLTQAGLSVDDAGWLYYALIDGWQQLVRDFGYWRVLAAAEAREADPARRAWYTEDRERREQLLMRDIGVLAHYVGDAGQPLHVSIHYNGWGDYPNPEGFTTSRQTHALFEEGFVRRNASLASVEEAMRAPRDCGADCTIQLRTSTYLLESLAEVTPLYRLEQGGHLVDGDAEGTAFMVARVAAGASELRDFVVTAWQASGSARVGWPAVRVADVEAGTADPWDAMVGLD